LKTCAIIPAYNEEGQIADVVRRTKEHVDSTIVVDDGSEDLTAEKAAGADFVLRHIINMGKGFALRTGIEKAIRDGSDVLVTIDADNQHDPADIPRLVNTLVSEDADIVFGSRSFDGDMPIILRAGNWWLCKSAGILFGADVSDSQSGFKVFKKEAYEKLKWKSSHYSVDSEIISKVGRNGLKHKQVPIKTIYHSKYKGTTVIDGVRIFLNMLSWRLGG